MLHFFSRIRRVPNLGTTQATWICKHLIHTKNQFAMLKTAENKADPTLNRQFISSRQCAMLEQ